MKMWQYVHCTIQVNRNRFTDLEFGVDFDFTTQEESKFTDEMRLSYMHSWDFRTIFCTRFLKAALSSRNMTYSTGKAISASFTVSWVSNAPHCTYRCVNVGWRGVIGVRQHGEHGDDDLLHAQDRPPALHCRLLLVELVLTRGVQDGDAYCSIFVHCSQEKREGQQGSKKREVNNTLLSIREVDPQEREL